MLNIIKSLFSENKTTAVGDEYKQQQREALIDLLVFAMYCDNHLAVAEEQVIDKRIEAMDWESVDSVEYYLERAIERIRVVRNDEHGREDLFQSINTRLGDTKAKRKAMDLCDKLFIADGEVVEAEKEFSQTLKNYLKLS